MTELEKIALAKSYIDNLAIGINPLDGTQIPDSDIVNNVRISRCLFYISDILGQVCENGGVKKPKRIPKVPFSLTPEQLERFEYSFRPIPVSEISKRIYALAENENMEKLSPTRINQWLLDIEMLCTIENSEGKTVKRPTSEGSQLGITTENRRSMYGNEYQAVLYNTEAQHFIIDNLDAIVATSTKNKTKAE